MNNFLDFYMHMLHEALIELNKNVHIVTFMFVNCVQS